MHDTAPLPAGDGPHEGVTPGPKNAGQRGTRADGECAPAPGAADALAPLALALPLTERPMRVTRPVVRPAVSEEAIGALVDAFYDLVRDDALLGPIFARHVTNWPRHLATMRDFWSTVILHSGRYAGRPFEVHQALPDLSPAHFQRWVAQWELTVNQVLAGADASVRAAFIVAARRMAGSMSSRLLRGA